MIEFTVDTPKEDIPEADLFLQPRFYALHRTRHDGHYFRLVDGEDTAGAAMFLAGAEGGFESPLRGSYGGLWVRPGSRLDRIEAFADAILGFFSKKPGAERLGIVLAPTAYDPVWTSQQYAILQDRGFKTVRSEVSQHIPVAADSFRQVVRKEKRRQMNKLERQGASARLATSRDYQRLYELLSLSREGGIPLSMTWGQVSEMVEAFPDQVLFAETILDGEPIAAAMALIVNPKTMYTLYYGNRSDSDGSPVLLALACLHEVCRDRTIERLDLGASSIDGRISSAIFGFKESLGAEPSLKFWLERAL
jgi:hypothetical protein